MSNIDKRALREVAENAKSVGDISRYEAMTALTEFEAAAKPATVLALLDEIAELEQGRCGAALLEREESHAKTVGKLLDELEAAEKRIAELEALEAKTVWPDIDMSDADCFTITRLHEIIYASELKWPEAKLLARFMHDVKQRAGTAKGE